MERTWKELQEVSTDDRLGGSWLRAYVTLGDEKVENGSNYKM